MLPSQRLRNLQWREIYWGISFGKVRSRKSRCRHLVRALLLYYNVANGERKKGHKSWSHLLPCVCSCVVYVCSYMCKCECPCFQPSASSSTDLHIIIIFWDRVSNRTWTGQKLTETGQGYTGLPASLEELHASTFPVLGLQVLRAAMARVLGGCWGLK